MKNCTATGCETTAAADLELCWQHRNRLQLDAVDAAALYDELLDIAANGTGASSDGPRVKGGEEKLGIDLDERYVEAREDIEYTLASWCRLIMDKAPRPLRADRPASVRQMGQFIGAHTSWLAAYEAAGAASDELGALVANAGELVQRDPERSVRTVEGLTCQHCGGELRAVMRRSTSLLPSFLECEQGHRLLPHEWADLVDQDQDVAEDRVPAPVAAAALGTSADGVYHLARRGRITRYETPEGPRYSLSEAKSLRREWDGVQAA